MSTVIAPKTFDYRYGDTVTNLVIPLPNNHVYSKGQQALVDYAVANGWALDITAIRNTYGYGLDRHEDEAHRRSFLKQHPFVFTRPGIDGGTWRVELDYVSREYSNYGNRGFTKTLKAARLTFTGDDGTVNTFDSKVSGYATRTGSKENTEIVLQPTSTASYSHTNWVWDAALEGEGYTLRERVQVLLADPDAVVSRAVELMVSSDARKKAAEAERVRVQALKARPLTPSWWELKKAAQAVVKSDGTSDPVALLAALKAAVAVVEGEVVVR